MADYLMYHINRTSLSRDINSLVDAYTKKKVTEISLQEYLSAWSENCPNLLFDGGNHEALSPKLVRLIGKKRGSIVLAALKDATR